MYVYAINPFPLFLFGTIVSVAQSARPIAYVHIGPPKTATSHFQLTVMYLKQNLEQEGVAVWPSEIIDNCTQVHHGPKEMAIFAHILNDTMVCPVFESTMRQFFKSNLEKNKTILLSAEQLYSASYFQASRLLRYLDGYKVHMIVAHRLEPSRLISAYNTRVKSFTPGSLADILRVSISINAVARTVKPLLDEKGGRLSIIDFYGMIAARKDISYVIFCEVLGILCSFDYSTVATLGENPSVDLTPFLVGKVFREYAAVSNCTYSNKNHLTYVVNSATSWWPNGISVPMHTIDMSALADEAKTRDRQLRQLFGALILHPNREANEAAERRNFTTVDEFALRSSHKWLHSFKLLLAKIEAERVCQ